MSQTNMRVAQAMGFARAAHIKQKRKYTDEPYYHHCLDVSRIVGNIVKDVEPIKEEMVIAALLHDVVEDTNITPDEIESVFGVTVRKLVEQVTDVSQPTDGNRAARKKKDLAHLSKSSYAGATIKLADLISNTKSIVEHDPKFAKVYLQEKEECLKVLQHGDKTMWNLARKTLEESKEKLNV